LNFFKEAYGNTKSICIFALCNSGCGAVRLAYTAGGRVVAGSNPVIPTKKRNCFVSSFFCFWPQSIFWRLQKPLTREKLRPFGFADSMPNSIERWSVQCVAWLPDDVL